MSLKPIEKLDFSVNNPGILFDELHQIDKNTFGVFLKINELIEVVNEQSKIIEDLKFRNRSGL